MRIMRGKELVPLAIAALMVAARSSPGATPSLTVAPSTGCATTTS
jgi:hypothetical protein